jgi:tetratricopeptide (TPR) repeat protein
MTEKQMANFRDLIGTIAIPPNDEITEESQEIYNEACDIRLLFYGHSEVLRQCLRAAVATGVRPYIYAVAAHVMICASYITDEKYVHPGMELAQMYLKQAQKYAPNRYEIDIIEADLYKSSAQLARLRASLDRFKHFPESKKHFYYAMLEMRYWNKMSQRKEARNWYEEARKRAGNTIQLSFAIFTFADILLFANQIDEPISLYEEILKINPVDSLTLHRLSLLYFKKGDSERAGVYNRRCMDIGDVPDSRNMLERLVAIWTKDRQNDPLKEVPRYIANYQGEAPKDELNSGFLGRLFGKS